MRSSVFNPQLNVATIGAFDGVHRGHQCLLKQVLRIANERNLGAIAITFRTSPRKVLGMADAPQLSTIKERSSLLYQAGMNGVELLDFTPQMAAMTAYDFMQRILKKQLHVTVLVVGYDHRFGRGRSEGFDDYVRFGYEIGIEVVRGDACIENGEPVSSTRIRHLLEEGEVDEAAQLLGYRYTLRGKVVDGYREGRKMGFPTANIRINNGQQTTDEEVDCKLIPADGVYAVYVNVVDNDNEDENENGQSSKLGARGSGLKGMLNIGYRPTLNNGQERSIEVHILDFEGDLYGKNITVEFAHRLREERRFVNTEELTAQLLRDEEKVRELLATEE